MSGASFTIPPTDESTAADDREYSTLESRVRRSRSFIAHVSIALLLAAVSACGSNEASRSRAAQSGAEKYIELVKAGKYGEAYERTFSKQYKLQIEPEDFVRYRGMLGASTGPVRSATLVKVEPKLNTNGFRVTYAIEGERITQPVFEVLDMIDEGDDWKVESLDMGGAGTPSR
jgi:hypothetical protein